ncbi:MAG: hypothetical protein LBC72_05660, partial [Spirochaetaceae bacterium]|jgi:hypothetical protein|nr:hypothetical protein [Spirochaetaceae bacterium]
MDYDRDLQKLPKSIARLKALKELRLTGTNVRELPPALLKRKRAGQLKIEFEVDGIHGQE